MTANSNSNVIKIISEPTADNPFVTIYKPHKMHSAPLTAINENDVAGNALLNDCDAMTESALLQAVKLFPEIKNVSGKKSCEYGLLHRLDYEAAGLLLIATTQKAYDFFLRTQQNGDFQKFYRAECDVLPENFSMLQGFPPPPTVAATAIPPTMTDVARLLQTEKTRSYQHSNISNCSHRTITAKSFFRAYGKGSREVRPVTELSGRAASKKTGTTLYETHIEIVENFSDSKRERATAYATCMITNGFRHQVRCHLAWCGFPVCGDELYNAHQKKACATNYSVRATEKSESYLKFESHKICFAHPLTQEQTTVSIETDDFKL